MGFKANLNNGNWSCLDRVETLRTWLSCLVFGIIDWFTLLPAFSRKCNWKPFAVSRPTMRWCQVLFATCKDISMQASLPRWKRCATLNESKQGRTLSSPRHQHKNCQENFSRPWRNDKKSYWKSWAFWISIVKSTLKTGLLKVPVPTQAEMEEFYSNLSKCKSNL